MGEENKVVYGLSNVHYSLYDADGSTFGIPVALPGAVKVSLAPEGEVSEFYADDAIYYLASTNNGYSGSIEMAELTQEARTALFAETVDTNGVAYETNNVQPPVFALLFEIDGNNHKKRYVFYACQATRPTVEHNTLESSKDPQTVTADLTILPLTMKVDASPVKVVKANVENTIEGAAAYGVWYTNVYTPGQLLSV